MFYTPMFIFWGWMCVDGGTALYRYVCMCPGKTGPSYPGQISRLLAPWVCTCICKCHKNVIHQVLIYEQADSNPIFLCKHQLSTHTGIPPVQKREMRCVHAPSESSLKHTEFKQLCIVYRGRYRGGYHTCGFA